ncbi:MAG: branched-chain amino acid ABC transporter substrate-binding protein [Desulfobacteraceae bacterium]|nr:branched-chain amino acid ABC transporter substrate-binding protein [Desulfobacteraceae bacterium]
MKNRWIGGRSIPKILALAVIVATACIMAGCAQKQDASKTQKAQALPPIKIAVVGSHSGDLASYGIPTVRAAELVVAQRNSVCGVNGRKVELIIEDDVCKPEIATNSATKVVGEGAQAVLGHICSGATKAALGIYKESKIVTMSPSATNPALTQSGEYPNFFRTIAADDAQAKLEVAFVLDVLKAKKIAVLHDKGDYGKGLAEFAKRFVEADSRGEVVLFEGITPGAVDYSAIVNKINQAGAEAVIYGGYHPEASKIVAQMRKKAMTTLFISDDGVKDDTFIKVAGEYAEGVYATGPVDTTQNPIAIEAIAAHKAKYGEEPGAFYLNAYAAILALINAFEKSCSTNYDDLVNALRSEWVATPLGIIKFDARGDAIGVGFAMYQVQSGKYVEVR